MCVPLIWATLPPRKHRKDTQHKHTREIKPSIVHTSEGEKNKDKHAHKGAREREEDWTPRGKKTSGLRHWQTRGKRKVPGRPMVLHREVKERERKKMLSGSNLWRWSQKQIPTLPWSFKYLNDRWHLSLQGLNWGNHLESHRTVLCGHSTLSHLVTQLHRKGVWKKKLNFCLCPVRNSLT